MGCAFYAMAYPAWFQQHYRRDGNNVFQGFGLFSFYSTGSLQSPFYASVTTLQYSDFWYCQARWTDVTGAIDGLPWISLSAH